MVYDQLKTMIADQLGVSEDEVKPETRLKEDLKADSATVMMLVMDIENEFDIEIEDDAIEKVKTVADLVKYIEDKQYPGDKQQQEARLSSWQHRYFKNKAKYFRPKVSKEVFGCCCQWQKQTNENGKPFGGAMGQSPISKNA